MKTTLLFLTLLLTHLGAKEKPTNILLITADDLGYEVLPFLGGSPKDITPNLSKLATEGVSFHNAHVNIAICAPSRSIIATGRYGFNSGCLGFNKLPKDIPTVFGTFQKNGYLTGILGKVPHSTTDLKFKWDFAHDYNDLNAGRSPKKYHDYTVEFLERCKKENKPFYFMVNSHDPHRPFHNPKKANPKWATPSKLYSPDEVTVPSYLTDLPEVREELAHYYNSVRRLDDTVGRVLEALEKSGLAENTLVIFITDNGSAFPFCYFNAADDLVGFDVASAYELARSLEVDLVFVPFEWNLLTTDLETGRFDIAMAGIYVTSDSYAASLRIRDVATTEPYFQSNLALLVPAKDAKRFASRKAINDRKDLKVASLPAPVMRGLIRRLLPAARAVTVNSYDDLPPFDGFDAALWTETQAVAQARVRQGLTAVRPADFGDPVLFAYLMSPDSVDFLRYVNYWLKLEATESFAQQMKVHWIQGQPRPDDRPRWSVLRNVLHWVP